MRAMDKLDDLIGNLNKKAAAKFGLVCLNCALSRVSKEEMLAFFVSNNVEIPDVSKSDRMSLIYELLKYYYLKYKNDKDIRKQYEGPIQYIGDSLAFKDKLVDLRTDFDFVAKQDLVDIFADYGADLGISTYDMYEKCKDDCGIDLYLTKKPTVIVKTEAVFIRTGHDLEEGYNEQLLQQIKEASKRAYWTVFVTTSYGACVVGLDRLIDDMENLNVWLYVVDPIHQRVHGITKGKKNDTEEALQQEIVQKLPKEPIRAPSQLGKMSKYAFSEKDSYKSRKFMLYKIEPEDLYTPKIETREIKAVHKDVFRKFLILDNVSSLNMFSYSNQKKDVDDIIISGFMSAIESFASELGGAGGGIKEINYKGFIINSISSENVKVILFLSEKSDKSLKERLDYFLNEFERKYLDVVTKFRKTGSSQSVPNDEILEMVHQILLI